MIAAVRWRARQSRSVPNGNWSKAREPKMGVMLHYDGSGTDAAAVAWFADPRCGVSYHLLVLDDGSYVRIAPDSARAWHAGYCRTSDPERLPYRDANSALLGIAAATNDHTDVTPLQTLTIAFLVRRWFDKYDWDPEDELWRIVGHNTEAVYPPSDPRAGQRGRKTDPVGGSPDNPILSVEDVRALVPLVGVA